MHSRDGIQIQQDLQGTLTPELAPTLNPPQTIQPGNLVWLKDKEGIVNVGFVVDDYQQAMSRFLLVLDEHGISVEPSSSIATPSKELDYANDLAMFEVEADRLLLERVVLGFEQQLASNRLSTMDDRFHIAEHGTKVKKGKRVPEGDSLTDTAKNDAMVLRKIPSPSGSDTLSRSTARDSRRLRLLTKSDATSIKHGLKSGKGAKNSRSRLGNAKIVRPTDSLESIQMMIAQDSLGETDDIKFKQTNPRERVKVLLYIIERP